MIFNEFQNTVEELFDSQHLNENQRFFVCTKYYNEYLAPQMSKDGVDSEVIKCINFLATTSGGHFRDDGLPKIPLNTFSGVLGVSATEYPFNCKFMYELIDELITNEEIFGKATPQPTNYDDLFLSKITLDANKSKELFLQIKFCMECCVRSRANVHKILEKWLNVYVLPEFRNKTITQDTLESIIKIAELVEEQFNSQPVVLNSKTAIHLMFDTEDKFKGFLSIKYLISIIIDALFKEVAIGTSVLFQLKDRLFQGTVIGKHGADFIVQHDKLEKGETASLVTLDEIKEVLCV